MSKELVAVMEENSVTALDKVIIGDEIQWFRDNDWILCLHSENSIGGQRYFVYIFMHPSGIYARGAGHNEGLALKNAHQQGVKRLTHLDEMVKECYGTDNPIVNFEL